MTDYTTYATGTGRRAYEVGTGTGRFLVHANNRAQAAATLRRAGHVVRDVNLVG